MIPEFWAFLLVGCLIVGGWLLFRLAGRQSRLVGEWLRARGWRVLFQEPRQLAGDPFSGEERLTRVVYIEALDGAGRKQRGYLRIPPWRLRGREPLRYAPLVKRLQVGGPPGEG